MSKIYPNTPAELIFSLLVLLLLTQVGCQKELDYMVDYGAVDIIPEEKAIIFLASLNKRIRWFHGKDSYCKFGIGGVTTFSEESNVYSYPRIAFTVIGRGNSYFLKIYPEGKRFCHIQISDRGPDDGSVLAKKATEALIALGARYKLLY